MLMSRKTGIGNGRFPRISTDFNGFPRISTVPMLCQGTQALGTVEHRHRWWNWTVMDEIQGPMLWL
jgi:hypothetical protein